MERSIFVYDNGLDQVSSSCQDQATSCRAWNMAVIADCCAADVELSGERSIELAVERLLDLSIVGVIGEREDAKDGQAGAEDMHSQATSRSGRLDIRGGGAEFEAPGKVDVGGDNQVVTPNGNADIARRQAAADGYLAYAGSHLCQGCRRDGDVGIGSC